MSDIPDCELCEWILANEQKIVDGTAEYNGLSVTESTEVVSYQWLVSLFVMRLEGETALVFSEQDNGAGLANIITALFGWWSLSGPFRTLAILASDGNRHSVASVIAEKRWGVKVHDKAADVAPQVETQPRLTKQAVLEVERRRQESSFDADLGIRLLPVKKRPETCEIQFDYPVSDGNQIVIRTEEVTLVIDKKNMDIFERKFLHFDGDQFLVCNLPEEAV